MQTGRPVVILAGWLGCKPRSLRRYESLYQKMGFTPLVRIAPPSLVMEGCSLTPNLPPPSEIKRRRAPPSSSLDDFGWEIIEAVYRGNPSVVVFHAFSNGGCFVWERIRDTLGQQSLDAETSCVLDAVRSKLVGVVFDSAPAWYYSEGLLRAFAYCTWQEQLMARAQWWTKSSKPITEQRAIHYWDSMRNDPCDLRQLYLYSREDHLTIYAKLHELVEHRQATFGTDRVLSEVFQSSPHCCHLLKHPSEYSAAVESFVRRCLYNSESPQSRSRL